MTWQRTHRISVAALALFLVVVLVLAWFAVDRIKTRILQDVEFTLLTVLSGTNESLDIWVKNKLLFSRHIARDVQLLPLVEALLVVPRDHETLRNHSLTTSLRRYFTPEMVQFGGEGFFIIAPDNISIASMRDDNLGVTNLIAEQRPDLLARVFAGESLFIPPVNTDLNVSDRPDLSLPPTMFFAQPLRNRAGEVIAAMTLRVDPAEDFSRMIQVGRIGHSGETYAFDQSARMISDSRFDQQLRNAGLLQAHEQAILNIIVRDPGGNMLEGYQPPLAHAQQPLTLMAASATQGNRGINLTGYRDYRGVSVFGAWMWNEVMGIGLTAEIDRDEALASYHTTRTTIIIVLIITVLSAVMGGSVAILVSEQANRALQRARDRLEDEVQARTFDLSRSEEQIRTIVASMVDGLITIDSDGIIRSINKAVETMFGYEPSELIGHNLKILMPEPYRSEHDGYLQRYHVTGERKVVGRRREVIGQRKDGSVFPLELAVSEVRTSDQVTFTGIISDITQRKVAEDELRKLSQAVEQSPVSVVITDLEGTIEYVNSTFTRVTGYSAQEVIGKNPRILNSGKQPQEFFTEMFATLVAGDTWQGEFCNKKKSGELYWESASISPIKDRDGTAEHYLAVKENITDRRAAAMALADAKELAESANQAKSDFLANMSHEIRTPMNAIIGLSNLCLKTELEPKQRDYISKVHIAAESLLGIINDILDFSKIEAGKMDMELIQFDLEEVLANVATMVTLKAQEKGLEFVIGTSPGAPRYLLGDPLRLGQVLINLVNNAVKFTVQGEISVLVEAQEVYEDTCLLKFIVRDTGIGMESQRIDKLFQSFSQADNSTTRKYGGTGLGLTICKRLVEMMNGEIAVESKLGEGSAFIFTARFGVSSRPIRELISPPDLQDLRVLVVDDSMTWCEILATQLRAFGFQVSMAYSGEEALERIEKDEPYALILMDWKMPGMNGIETARCIHGKDDLTAIPTIIMVTAFGREEIQSEAEISGINAFLIKPVSPSILFDTIMDVFGKAVSPRLPVMEDTQENGELIEQLRGVRVLLVEDNEFNQQVAQEVLEQRGLQVDIAANGRQAVELVAQYAYAAVLMDVQMPEMDGFEATRLIRQQPQHQGLPIIAMTAGVLAADREQCFAAGMNDHIGKPINTDELFATLSKWILKKGQADLVVHDREDTDKQPAADLPVDISVLSALVGDSPAVHQRFLLKFLDEARRVVQQVHAGIEENDAAQVGALGHKLKSSAKAVGAQLLADCCDRLEVAGKRADWDSIKEVMPVLDGSLERVTTYIEKATD